MIKIDFFFETQYGKFADALHLPDDHGLLDEQIQALKQQRLDNWISAVSYVPTEEEVQLGAETSEQTPGE